MLRPGFPTIALALAIAALLPATATAGPVATNDASYQALGAVFPDPLGGCQRLGQSPCDPKARGNVPATTHIGIQEFIDGITYMNQKPEWGRYMEILALDGKLGDGSATRAEIQAKPSTMAPGNNLGNLEWDPRPEYVSAGIPTTTLGRQKSDLMIVRVTDETVPDAGKRRYTLSLSIHGIERAGAEGGIRAMEEMVTAQGTPHANDTIVPKEAKGKAPTFQQAIKGTIIYFTIPNPDGWRRGSVSSGGFNFQRYTGNGIDPNRDWPDIGYSFRGYSGNSEPETRGFFDFYQQQLAGGRRFDAGDDLHGQPFADALSYTLMPHGSHDVGKDTRIRETVKTINRASYEAVKWSPQIIPNDQPVGGSPGGCAPGIPAVGAPAGTMCTRIYGQTWGTVYDTINYTTTGTLGDWFDSEKVGLNADGIDNEMSFSHIDRNIVFERHGEQLHVAGNKAIIYAHVADLLDPISNSVYTGGKNAYVEGARLKRNQITRDAGPPPGTKPQDDVVNALATPNPGENGASVYTFEVKRGGGIYSGGMRVDATTMNLQGVGTGGATLTVQCLGCDEHIGSKDDEWVTVGEDYNQSPIYQQAGITVAINRPDGFQKDGKPVQWRAIVSAGAGGVLNGPPAPIGPARIDIDFTSGPASADGPTGGDKPSFERAYDVANTDFFDDLNPFIANRSERFEKLNPASTSVSELAKYKNVVLADDIWPGANPGQREAWAAKLKQYVAGGGNLVLTDAALTDLPRFVGLKAADIKKQTVYVGQVSFQRCLEYAAAGTCNTTESTLKEPLTRGVAQPAARFNSGQRRQTYEPTPLGFAIQSDTGGDQSNARQYDIDGRAFKAAGGAIAASSTDSSPRQTVAQPHRVTMGEFKMGKGTLRVLGALLPQPETKFDHPLGLEPYAVTYTGYILLCNLLDADCLTTRSGVIDPTQFGPGGAGSSIGGVTPRGAAVPVACAASAGFRRTAVKGSGRSLAFTLDRNLNSPATVEVFRVSQGRRVLANRRVARFRNRTSSFRWRTSKRVGDGIYFVRYRMPVGRITDYRRHVLERKKGKWRVRPDYYGKANCDIFRSVKLESPAFGGTRSTRLRIAYRLAQSGSVRVSVLKGKRVVRRYAARRTAAERTQRLIVPGRSTRRRGDYKVRIDATRNGRTTRVTLTSKRL